MALAEALKDFIAFAPRLETAIGDYSATATTLLQTVKEADDGLRALSGGGIDVFSPSP